VTSEQNDPFDPAPIPEDLQKVWLERGLPEDLLTRAAELRSFGILRGFLRWGGNNEESVRKRLDWQERLLLGELRGREATEADNDQFSDLMANSPEEVGE
jgi:hypothetical protein